MSPDVTRQLFGGVSTALGLMWVGFLYLSPIRGLWLGEREPHILVFELTFGSLLACPGVLATVAGVHLLRAMDASSLKMAVGSLAVIGAVMLATLLDALMPDLLPESIGLIAVLFLCSGVGVVAYLFIARRLLLSVAGQEPTLASLTSRWVLMLMAWQLWMLLFSIFDEYAPVKSGYTHIHEEPWDTLALLVPIVVAYVAYRLLAGIIANSTE